VARAILHTAGVLLGQPRSGRSTPDRKGQLG
jgi:hypothetical protein